MSNKRPHSDSDKDQVEVLSKTQKVTRHAHHPSWKCMRYFKLVEILSDDAQTKSLILHAKASLVLDTDGETETESQNQSGTQQTLGNGDCSTTASSKAQPEDDNATGDAVIILEKSAFDTSEESISKLLSSDTALNVIFNNDIFGTYEGLPTVNPLKATIIFPAQQKHIEKYRSHDGDIIYETTDDYREITEPWIKEASFDMTWIYNILEKKKESEFIVFEDPDPINGFILLPDLKWDKKSIDNMYISAIVHRHGIKSLRDLSSEHLPLLKNILEAGMNAIGKKYGLKRSKIRAYIHYQPTYYHLHVHFNQIKYTAPGINVLKAHLLSDVIENIEMMSDFYKKKTLPFVARENTDLYKKFKEANKV